MSDINLLPQEMRAKEEKEKRALLSRPKVFDVMLSNPERTAEMAIGKKSKIKRESFWRRILGRSSLSGATGGLIKKNGETADFNRDINLSASVPKKSLLTADSPNIAKNKSKTWQHFAPAEKTGGFNRVWPKNTNQTQKPESSFIGFLPADRLSKIDPKPISARKKNRWFGALKSRLIRFFFYLKTVKIFDRHEIRENPIAQTMIRDVMTKKASPVPLMAAKKTALANMNDSFFQDASRNTAFKRKISINLAPNDLLGRKFNIGFTAGSLVLAVLLPVLILTAGFYFVTAAQKNVDQKIAAGEKIIAELKQRSAGNQEDKKESVLLAQKILALQGILERHVYWSNFFTLLEKYTLDGVYYSGFSARVGDKFSLPATAKNYEEAAKQIAVFENAADFIEQVGVYKISLRTEANKGAVGVDFSLEIKPVSDVFIKTAAE